MKFQLHILLLFFGVKVTSGANICERRAAYESGRNFGRILFYHIRISDGTMDPRIKHLLSQIECSIPKNSGFEIQNEDVTVSDCQNFEVHLNSIKNNAEYPKNYDRIEIFVNFPSIDKFYKCDYIQIFKNVDLFANLNLVRFDEVLTPGFKSLNIPFVASIDAKQEIASEHVQKICWKFIREILGIPDESDAAFKITIPMMATALIGFATGLFLMTFMIPFGWLLWKRRKSKLLEQKIVESAETQAVKPKEKPKKCGGPIPRDCSTQEAPPTGAARERVDEVARLSSAPCWLAARTTERNQFSSFVFVFWVPGYKSEVPSDLPNRSGILPKRTNHPKVKNTGISQRQIKTHHSVKKSGKAKRNPISGKYSNISNYSFNETVRLKIKIITKLEKLSTKYSKPFKWDKSQPENEEVMKLQYEIIKSEVLEMKSDFEEMKKIYSKLSEMLEILDRDDQKEATNVELQNQKEAQQQAITVSEKETPNEELEAIDIKISKMVDMSKLDDIFAQIKIQKGDHKPIVKTENERTTENSGQNPSQITIKNSTNENEENMENPKNEENIENPKKEENNQEKTENSTKNQEKIEKIEKTQKDESNNGNENPKHFYNTGKFLLKKDIIEIPPFDGKPENFSTFIELFENLVDKDKDMPNVLKFAALKSLTTDTAAEQIARYPGDGSLYEEALQKLKTMFGSVNRQYTAIWENIKKLKPAKNDVVSCRRVLNDLAISIQKLKRLGFETNGLPYLAEIKSKLPRNLLSEVVKKERRLPNQRFGNV
ncbi:unnamed protein product [Caenorhabditis angaria]|uniref:Domain of unknown function WSN domain-containing protein n=1 Tax=Caenorhabditis angaria TaxID=860376 RepID=A0A9P1IL63_9PELO|nr:unnamed protein product [Caenorhabditis angaria]